ncbi:hypothetical protein TIFTF001_016740 [Ficus carica]|uniref:Uncharacterized protein n=1 Tax=Ficus carica TaxID=3494 RepID=A0AA88APC9_FICCA|nr:hypothetical protein TIFTF001_016740 [Ficus carica]
MVDGVLIGCDKLGGCMLRVGVVLGLPEAYLYNCRVNLADEVAEQVLTVEEYLKE